MVSAGDGRVEPEKGGKTTERLARLPRRFYEQVGREQRGPDWLIMLDGRPVRTPGKAELMLPTVELADEIVREWANQARHIDPTTMPLTILANTAIDRVKAHRDAIVGEIVSYAGSDLLCYRAEGPAELQAAQQRRWDPVLAALRDRYELRFRLAAGVMHVEQPAGTLDGVQAVFRAYDAFRLAPLHTITTLTGSAVLALGYAERLMSLQDVWDAAHVDEDWQVARWGQDDEIVRRRASHWKELEASALFLECVGGRL